MNVAMTGHVFLRGGNAQMAANELHSNNAENEQRRNINCVFAGRVCTRRLVCTGRLQQPRLRLLLRLPLGLYCGQSKTTTTVQALYRPLKVYPAALSLSLDPKILHEAPVTRPHVYASVVGQVASRKARTNLPCRRR